MTISLYIAFIKATLIATAITVLMTLFFSILGVFLFL